MRLLQKKLNKANEAVRTIPVDTSSIKEFQNAIKAVKRVEVSGLLVCSLYLSPTEWDVWVEGETNCYNRLFKESLESRLEDNAIKIRDTSIELVNLQAERARLLSALKEVS